jgi:SagB-type dehydrogenase family enzyme
LIAHQQYLLVNPNKPKQMILPNKNKTHPLIITLILALTISACAIQGLPADHDQLVEKDSVDMERTPIIPLPEPNLQGNLSFEETLADRRSVRQFEDTPLTEAQIGQLLWAAQGITHPSGLRTSPSAGALYPLEVYAATQDGLFRYRPHTHSLERVLEHDPRPALHQAALRQNAVLEAPLVIVINAVFERTAQKYGEVRTPQYVYLEAGHAAQNILLQAVALELGAVPIGAFHEDQLTEALALPPDQTPLYLIPVGQPQ